VADFKRGTNTACEYLCELSLAYQTVKPWKWNVNFLTSVRLERCSHGPLA